MAEAASIRMTVRCEEMTREPSIRVEYQLPGAFCRSPVIRCSGGRVNRRGDNGRVGGGAGRCERPPIKRAIREWRAEIAQKTHIKKRRTEEAIAQSLSGRERLSECSVDSGGDGGGGEKVEARRESGGDGEVRRERVEQCGVDNGDGGVGCGGDGGGFSLSQLATATPGLSQPATAQNSSPFKLSYLNTAPSLSQLSTATHSLSQLATAGLNTAPSLSQLATAQNSSPFKLSHLNTAPSLSQLSTATHSLSQLATAGQNTAPSLSQLSTATHSLSQLATAGENTAPSLSQLATAQNSSAFSISPLNTASTLSQLSTGQHSNNSSLSQLATASPSLSQLATAQNSSQATLTRPTAEQTTASPLSQLAASQNRTPLTISPLNTAQHSTSLASLSQPATDTGTDSSLSHITKSHLNITTSTSSPLNITANTHSCLSSLANASTSSSSSSSSPSLSSLAALHLNMTNTNALSNITVPPLALSIPPLTIPHTETQGSTRGGTQTHTAIPPPGLSIPPLTNTHTLAQTVPPLTNTHTQTNAWSQEEDEDLDGLIGGMEWDTDSEIDLQSALLTEKPTEKETAPQTDSKHNYHGPPPPVIEYTHTHVLTHADMSLLKAMPSPFGAVVAEVLPRRRADRQPLENVICVPFSVFQFDTPSPDEEVEIAKNDPSNPSRYKLITVDRMTKR